MMEYHYSQPLAVVVTICALMSGKGHYEYQEGEILYFAAEGPRLIQLREVRIRETSNPANDWGLLLVEPCDPAYAQRVFPCWPGQKQQRSQQLLARIQSELPDYRTCYGLLEVAKYVNRDVGAFHPTWVVGTNPLAVAFRRGTGDPKPYADLKLHHGSTTRPSTTPGVIEIVSRSGRTRVYDLRARHAQLVGSDDLKIEADVVLIFPRDMKLPGGHVRSEASTQPAPKLKFFYLREPSSLGTIMRQLTETNGLKRSADSFEEVPVRPA